MRRTSLVIAVALVTIAGTAGIRALRSASGPAPKPPVLAGPVRKTRPTSLVASTTDTPISRTRTSTTPTTTLNPLSPTHAALRMLRLDERLFPATSPQEARALTESIAATDDRARLGAHAEDHQRQVLAKGDLGGLRLRIAPIVTRTRNCAVTVCTVDVYFLRLWSFPGRGALDDYATVEIRLVSENGEWRLHDSMLVDGPHPAGRYSSRPVSSAASTSFEASLAGFSNIEVTP